MSSNKIIHALTLAAAVALLAKTSLLAKAGDRVVMQQDVIPAAVAGDGAFQYQCIARGLGASAYSYVCNPPGCVMPAGMGIDAGGTITVKDPTRVSPGVKKVTLTLQNGGYSVQQDVLVEVVKPNASGANWCPRGSFGGDVSSVAVAPDFATSGFAYAAGTTGGLYKTQDAGLSWSAVPGFGSLPVTALAGDGCAAPLKIWAVTGPASRALLTDVGPLGNVSLGIAPVGAIFRYDSVLTPETIYNSLGAPGLTLPATWISNRRRLVQASGLCAGPMLASDLAGGILWRDPADGAWRERINGLAGAQILDIAYGYGASTATRQTAAALVNFSGSVYIYSNSNLLNDGIWSQCANLSALPGITGKWQALGLAPDGQLLAATANGETVIANLGNCASPPMPGPGFVDAQGTLPVSTQPSINGFVFPSCYGGSGQQQTFAYTDSGIYYTANISTTNFTRFSSGLLSEEVTSMAVSPSCADKRIIAGTRRSGPAWGDDQGFCQAQLKTSAAFNGLAVGANFISDAQGSCLNSAAPYDLYASSVNQGIFHGDANGQSFFTAGDTREQALRDFTSARNGAGFKLYGISYSGVYDSDGSPAYNYQFSRDMLLKIRGSAGLTDGSAYAISDGNLYASYGPLGWGDKLVDLYAISNAACASGATDLAAGGKNGNQKDLVWIACGAGGLVEARIDSANGVTGVLHAIPNSQILKVAASAVANQNNRLLVQSYAIGGFGYYCGSKLTLLPDAPIAFTACGVGLPKDEEALQLLAEPNRADNGTGFWALYPTQGLFYSVDAGSNFTQVAGTGLPGGLPKRYIPAALVLSGNYNRPAGRRTLALQVAGQGIYYSADGGQSFCSGPAQVSALPSSVRGFTTGVFSNDVLYAATDAGVFFSGDGGVHWHNRSYNALPVRVIASHKLTATTEAVLAGGASGIWRSLDRGVSWTQVVASGNITAIARDFKSCSNDLIATVAGGSILASIDGGATWAAQSGPTDGVAADRQNGGCLSGFAKASATVTAPYWAAGASSGASYSPTGATWTTANGGNDYLLPTVSGFASVKTLGGSPSQVLVGHSTQGLWRTLDGGDSWRKVSAAGSGLEATSQNASALLTAATAYATTDVLVGMTGSSTGGVYLSGDSGEHWTQVNSGFDPGNLSISSLVKTSCSGCPVQYYSGSYGGGMYTRTITVAAPPFSTTAASWCAGAGCACGTGTFSGLEQGGQSFKLCGGNFQSGLVVEFDGVPASACTVTTSTSPQTIVCSTPPHVPGNALLRVRNPDTRTASLPAAYSFVSGISRALGLTVAKSGANAALAWSCAGCDSTHPARLYRSQNTGFSLYLEIYNGGIGGGYTNTDAVASAQSYFWSVE